MNAAPLQKNNYSQPFPAFITATEAIYFLAFNEIKSLDEILGELASWPAWIWEENPPFEIYGNLYADCIQAENKGQKWPSKRWLIGDRRKEGYALDAKTYLQHLLKKKGQEWKSFDLNAFMADLKKRTEKLFAAEKDFFEHARKKSYSVSGIHVKTGVSDVCEIPTAVFLREDTRYDIKSNSLFEPEKAQGTFTALWSKLKVASSDFAKAFEGNIGSSSSIAVSRTGCAGRPSSKQFMLDEMKRRKETNSLESTLAAETRYLLDWLSKTHPQLLRPQFKSAENALREQFSAFKKGMK